MIDAPRQLTVGIVLFDQFELLDVYGPAEMLGLCGERFETVIVGPEEGPVASAQGPRSVADVSYAEAPPCDVVLVPGGLGTRKLVNDRAFLEWLSAWAAKAEYVTSVCTGSALLASCGLLDGRRATSNKVAFGWAVSQSDGVTWIPEARWVEDGDRWTSSGVSAGIDMALALIAHLFGHNFAVERACIAEYEWHQDPGWDPFAALSGLVDGK